MAEDELTPFWLSLILNQRWAALGTIDDEGCPYVSSVAFAPVQGGLLMHLSELAPHTQNLLGHPLASILISEPDTGDEIDPQKLARISLSGQIHKIERGNPGYGEFVNQYAEKFPESEMRFGFSDFHLFLLEPANGNFVGGFGKAGKVEGSKILETLARVKLD